MVKNSVLLLILLFQINLIKAQQDSNFYQPPPWAKKQIWYQIFVERFNNGDPTNDPLPHNISSSTDFRPVPGNWEVTPWTNNWYET
ncbi:MAG: hypothetical protein CL661_11690, partial [Bacteroidetes bacterium]|nr:hypothetical protein [Bacteroidota bacterium]